MSEAMPIAIDIELTNRCNASCRFCPREATPHQGMMAPATFDRALERATEYLAVRDQTFPEQPIGLTFCGMGEPLLHPRLPEYVGRVRDAGIQPNLSSNGSLLDEHKARALLDAGLEAIYLNIGEHDEDYERTYQLPFERTLENVVRFHEMSDGRCEVVAVLVDHRDDPDHLEEMRSFWSTQGIDHTFTYGLSNRGGSLSVDHMQYQHLPELPEAWHAIDRRTGTPMCGVPFHRLFVGYDGNYYLCGADWEKRAQLGSVHDRSFLELTEEKLAYVTGRRPVCETCNVDPTNQFAEVLAASAAGTLTDDEVAAQLDFQILRVAVAHERVERLGFTVPAAPAPVPTRRLIPVEPARQDC